jgi:hypothetical protein
LQYPPKFSQIGILQPSPPQTTCDTNVSVEPITIYLCHLFWQFVIHKKTQDSIFSKNAQKATIQKRYVGFSSVQILFGKTNKKGSFLPVTFG